MYDRILVPLDGAKFSEEMLPHAAALARVHGTPLTLLRVVDNEDEKSEAQASLKPLTDRLLAQGLCVVGHGDRVTDVIVEEARRMPRTLIAMTSHGRGGLMEVVLGNVARRVVHSIGAPVLVYRPRGTQERDSAPISVDKVVLPLDGTDVSETIAPQAAELAKWLGAELLVVGVVDPSARAAARIPAGDVLESSYVRTQAAAYAAEYGVRVGWEVLHGEPAQAIPEFVRGRHDAILAMTTRGRRAIEAALLGSVTAACLRTSGVPVLIRLP